MEIYYEDGDIVDQNYQASSIANEIMYDCLIN